MLLPTCQDTPPDGYIASEGAFLVNVLACNQTSTRGREHTVLPQWNLRNRDGFSQPVLRKKAAYAAEPIPRRASLLSHQILGKLGTEVRLSSSTTIGVEHKSCSQTIRLKWALP